MATERIRLDVMLAELGLFSSRERAQAAVMAGIVRVDGKVAMKPGTRYPEGVQVEVAQDAMPYVSRGGLKLEKALDEWGIGVARRVCMDVGASTGGFTDLMLQRGASKVYSVDVGYGQLDWKLRNDPRVVVLERTNFRYFDPASIDEKPSFICIDVSFISLGLILPVAAALLADAKGELVALVKPQFEAGREQVGKGGIVRDPSIHAEVIEKVRGYAAGCGLAAVSTVESPIKGAKGNTEFLMRCIHG